MAIVNLAWGTVVVADNAGMSVDAEVDSVVTQQALIDNVEYFPRMFRDAEGILKNLGWEVIPG